MNDFKPVNTPEQADTAYLEMLDRLMGNDFKLPEATAAAIDRVNDLMRPALNPETLANGRTNELPRKRAFDLHYEYTSFAPVGERWTCIDLNTYDGAPDSEGCSTFIGRGRDMAEARNDLVAMFRDHDNPPRQRIGQLVDGGGGVQPADYVDDYRDPDEQD